MTWPPVIIVVLIIVGLLVLGIIYRYKKLDEESKKIVQSALRKMGIFLILGAVLLPLAASEDAPVFDSVSNTHPIILPGNELMQAGAGLGAFMGEDDLWRAGALAFLAGAGNNNSTTNSTNLTFYGGL